MRKESSNALLKIIEEPARDTFFFLMTNSLNILSTIKSRAILVEVNNLIETDEEINPIFEIVDKFLSQRDFQDELDRISLVEEIIRQSERDREIYRKIVKRILYYFKKNKDLEKYLEIKKYFRFPINDRGILQTLFLKI
jgi:DNA polymerase-3 subunit delta'